jgi:hypothetical protein
MLTITLLLFASVPLWLLVRRVIRRRAEAARWRVVTRTIEDGTRQVVLTGPGGERVMRELPATLDGLALETELMDARSKAFAEALRLNRRPQAPRAHA